MPQTDNSFKMIFFGTVKAGLKNVEDVKFDVDDAKKRLTITVPKVEVTEVKTDASKSEEFEVKHGLFNRISPKASQELQAKVEKKAEQEAIDNGLLERAQARVEELLRAQAEAATAGTGYSVEIKQD